MTGIVFVKLSTMTKNKKIYHRNDLRLALSKLSLPPRRILWLILAQLNKNDDGDIIYHENTVFMIHAREYAALCDIDESVAYKQLKTGVEEIRTHLMRISESDLYPPEELAKRKRPKDTVVLFTIANYGAYSDGSGFIEVQLDPIMTPFISQFKSNFTGQFLLSSLRLSDTNASKLYLLLREWISAGCVLYKEIDVEELKTLLDIQDKKAYNRFNLFSSSFFHRAVHAVLESTEFTKIDMEIIERRARKAHKVRISYEFEGQGKDLKDAGFIVGEKGKKKNKNDGTAIGQDDKSEQSSDAVTSGGLKQINGRFFDEKTARASGLDWDAA